MRIALAPRGIMRQTQASDETRASRRWTAAIVAAVMLHAAGLVIAGRWSPPAPPPAVDPPAFKVELVRLPPSRPQPKRMPHETTRPIPKHVVVQPPRPHVARVAAPPRRVHLTMPKTQFHHVAVAAPPVTANDSAIAVPRAAPPQPVSAPVAPVPAPAAAPAAPAATAAPALPANPNAVPNWQGLLLARLAKFKQYPAGARARNQQGVAYVHFSVDRRGHVLSATLDTSSGYDLLDAEALALMHRADPLPPPPAEMPAPVDLVVPIVFSLKSGGF